MQCITGVFIISLALLYLAVFFLELLDAVPNQNEDLTVCGAPLVVGNIVQFIEHLVVDSQGYTFYRHNIIPF